MGGKCGSLLLLCKTLTGHGLPGTLLGSIEGVSWLVLPLGFGSLAPRLGDLGKAGDIGEAIKILSQEGRAYEGFGEDSRGKNATERLVRVLRSCLKALVVRSLMIRLLRRLARSGPSTSAR